MKQFSQEEDKIRKKKQLVLGAAFVHDDNATVPVCGLLPFPRPDRLFSAGLAAGLQQCCGRSFNRTLLCKSKEERQSRQNSTAGRGRAHSPWDLCSRG